MTDQSRPLRVALIGFGEVGSSIGAGLKAGGADLVAHDSGYLTPPFAELIQRRARETGVPLASSVPEAVEGVDLILAMVPGSAAYGVAEEAAPRLKPGQLYADLGTASPPIKEKISVLLEPTRASFVDVAIMGSLAQEAHRVATLVSGREAARYREMLEPFGMKIELAGERPGRAAAIKMFRSIMTKGIEALILETLIACRKWDVTAEVMSSVSRSLDKQPFYPGWVAHATRGTAIHAMRRAHEVDMVMETLRDVGVEPLATQGTAARLHWAADLGLREYFGGVAPDDWNQIIDEVMARSIPS